MKRSGRFDLEETHKNIIGFLWMPLKQKINFYFILICLSMRSIQKLASYQLSPSTIAICRRIQSGSVKWLQQLQLLQLL